GRSSRHGDLQSAYHDRYCPHGVHGGIHRGTGRREPGGPDGGNYERWRRPAYGTGSQCAHIYGRTTSELVGRVVELDDGAGESEFSTDSRSVGPGDLYRDGQRYVARR